MRDLAPDVVERNYSKEPLTRAEVKRILAAAPSVAAVMNTRHKVVKQNGWKEKPPGRATFTTAVLEEPNLLRRPLLLRGGELVVGKDEDPIRALLG